MKMCDSYTDWKGFNLLSADPQMNLHFLAASSTFICNKHLVSSAPIALLYIEAVSWPLVRGPGFTLEYQERGSFATDEDGGDT